MANLVTTDDIEALGLSPAIPALVDVAEPILNSEPNGIGDDDGDAP